MQSSDIVCYRIAVHCDSLLECNCYQLAIHQLLLTAINCYIHLYTIYCFHFYHGKPRTAKASAALSPTRPEMPSSCPCACCFLDEEIAVSYHNGQIGRVHVIGC